MHALWFFLIPFVTAIVVTPLVIRLSYRIGALAMPDPRKVHKKPMPTIGGLAIFIAVMVGYIFGAFNHEELTGISIGAVVIVVTGLLDDRFDISARMKLLGQAVAALCVIGSGLSIEILNIPFVGIIDLGTFSYVLTFLWIIGITNAINLIDGLDGLSAGISAIAIASIAAIAGVSGKTLILSLALLVLGGTLGFLFYNFYPAKTFMGDTGALFLGYSISVLSLLGLYKSVTLFSFVVPVLILGVPIFDTLVAVVRRIVQKKSIVAPDKSHMHHRLLAMGFTHRGTVLLLYAFGAMFSMAAIAFESATIWVTLMIIAVLVLL
ncbi:MAG: glycosyltransferase family 4 protein, partial [Bacilli bacterium]